MTFIRFCIKCERPIWLWHSWSDNGHGPEHESCRFGGSPPPESSEDVAQRARLRWAERREERVIE